jgi:hypothetical protein
MYDVFYSAKTGGFRAAEVGMNRYMQWAHNSGGYTAWLGVKGGAGGIFLFESRVNP